MAAEHAVYHFARTRSGLSRAINSRAFTEVAQVRDRPTKIATVLGVSSLQRNPTLQPASAPYRGGIMFDVASIYTGGDFELAWPRDLFRVELASLINTQKELKDWDGRVELLLEDAFATVVPRDMFTNAKSNAGESWATTSRIANDAPRRFLVNLLRQADALREPTERTPYWSERRSTPVARGAITIATVARELERAVRQLDGRGYFEQAFEKDCVDDPSTVNAADLLESLTGRPNLWWPKPVELADDRDSLFDLIEVLHDLVSMPRTRWMHSYAGCGYHHGSFSREAGRALYTWRVNRILNQSDLGVRLATDGEDAGRLVEITDEGRADLVQRMVQREDEGTGDRVRHAIALFRSRSATEHDKRSAVVALALVLEERRALLKAELLSKDEGSLFHVANSFAIRHQDLKQQADYDLAFLDWIYWWYLATVELTDRLLERGGAAGPPHGEPASF